jgi:type VI secretion system secreted protein VgrG
VIVNFLNGDPDRPVAIGSLYNGNNTIPKSLPANKTQSYIKTQSMPGGSENFNLLLFEDKGGDELVHMQAEKNHLLHVKHDSDNNIDHDESTTVGNDRTESVGRDESIDIGHNRTESVGNDETISIGNDQEITIGHDQNNHILNTQANKIDKDKITYVGNHRVDETYANQTLKVGGHYDVTVNGKLDTKAGEHIKSVTKLYQIDAKTFTAKGKAGTIIIDGGITLKGNVTIKGNVSITAGSPEGVASFNARANTGDPICWKCLFKDVIEEAKDAKS